MPSLNTKVKAFRLPLPLVAQLEAPNIKEHAVLLIKILLEDFFAGKNFYSKSRFEAAKKAKASVSNSFKKAI